MNVARTRRRASLADWRPVVSFSVALVLGCIVAQTSTGGAQAQTSGDVTYTKDIAPITSAARDATRRGSRQCYPATTKKCGMGAPPSSAPASAARRVIPPWSSRRHRHPEIQRNDRAERRKRAQDARWARRRGEGTRRNAAARYPTAVVTTPPGSCVKCRSSPSRATR